jgi:diadenosine tetraphosphate (Ap4A) HIT family hydrolase
MSHIYQPVMIKTLLINNGKASRRQIASAILMYDFSQIEYYEKVTDNMVGKVLRNNGIVYKSKDTYHLVDFNPASAQEIERLIVLCNEKIDLFLKKRGDLVWDHRRRNRKSVPGSIRYEVLKRARGRCELCGISKDEKALEVDHIVPKNLGGADSINNYQALCYSCNAAKRDTDQTDFRGTEDFYKKRGINCIFCDPGTEMIDENNLAFAIWDRFPVTEFHSLIIPKRHCSDYFQLEQPELNAVFLLSRQIRNEIVTKDTSISGFNIGFNVSKTGGQTIPHCHMHLIPRREGDVPNPIGGIRNVIVGKGDYLNSVK